MLIKIFLKGLTLLFKYLNYYIKHNIIVIVRRFRLIFLIKRFKAGKVVESIYKIKIVSN